jgi:hypothetical protein
MQRSVHSYILQWTSLTRHVDAVDEHMEEGNPDDAGNRRARSHSSRQPTKSSEGGCQEGVWPGAAGQRG